MINQDYFRGKRVTVVGLGRSGFACAKLLSDIGARVSVTERENNTQVMNYARKLPAGIRQELGRHTRELIEDSDLIVTSPGVDNRSQPLVWAKEFALPVISEIECAWVLCPAPVIAVTGTNGKTTTTTLIGRVLEAAGRKAFILGNIGTPFSARVQEMERRDFVSLEVSSFQLETIAAFKPKISVILNFRPDHLDRYTDLSEYLSAKSRILINQDESDYSVLNYDDPVVADLAKKSKAKVVYFDSRMHLNPNFAAAMAVASILGIDPHSCQEALRSFKGLPHRLEWICEFQGREFINDSKATNPDATAFALLNVKKPVVLIAGGRDKGFDYAVMRDLICEGVRSLVLIGEAREKIRQVFKDSLPIKEASSLPEAADFAFRDSRPGDCILLSPMCSSFDMFRDYRQRGDVFKEAVRGLIKSAAKTH